MAADRSIKLVEFSGDLTQDKMTIIEYISHVEMSRIAGGWDDAITAEKVKLKLTGHARTWLLNRIRQATPGLAAFNPELVAGNRPPGLRSMLINRFMPQQTAAEQGQLRASLVQSENESVHNFFDRVESIQFILDMELPAEFRDRQKASYDIVHDQQVKGNFIMGLKEDIRRHVTTLNVATIQDALKAAVAFEKASTSKNKVNSISSVSEIHAVESRGGYHTGGRGRGPGKSGCFYCGFLGHIKAECRMRQQDESSGVFQQHSAGYQPGRVGRGSSRGRGGAQDTQRGYPRGRSSGNYRGSYRGRGNYLQAMQQPMQQQQEPQQQQPVLQQPQVPQPQMQNAEFPRFEDYNMAAQNQGTFNMGAFRYFPEN